MVTRQQASARTPVAAATIRKGACLLCALLLGVILGAFEVVSAHFGFSGPSINLLHDVVGVPKSGPVLWAGLALAMVGLTNRRRMWCLSLAVFLDLVCILGRFVASDARVTFGNGALIVLTGLGIYAAIRWFGPTRVNALKGVGLGFLLIGTTKISDAWLAITARTRPFVWDEYAQTADHALGNPSWSFGRFVDALGPIGYQVLHTTYIELPIGALVITLYQLRNGWPSHHLVRTFLLIGMVGPLVYLLFPVVGPVFAFGPDGGGWALQNSWPRVVPLNLHPQAIRFDSVTARNCMPSLHTAWVVAMFVHSRSGTRWVRWLGTFWLVCTLTATLGFGYHYGIDLVVGVVFSLTIETALRDPERGWGWFRVRLLLAGAATMAVMLLSFRYQAVPMAEHPWLAGGALLVSLGALIMAFFATFFAQPGTPLGRWGCRGDVRCLIREPAVATVG